MNTVKEKAILRLEALQQEGHMTLQRIRDIIIEIKDMLPEEDEDFNEFPLTEDKDGGEYYQIERSWSKILGGLVGAVKTEVISEESIKLQDTNTEGGV